MSEATVRPMNASAPGFDPGLTKTYTGALNRVVNKDGQFNVRRAGATVRDANPYTFMVSTSWPVFWSIISFAFAIINVVFAELYIAVGSNHIKGAEAKTAGLHFLNIFFFSTHTLTTVGYGNMYPEGTLANLVASIEALVGLMGFAIATGLLFGRFSRPTARFGFSPMMVLAPYQGRTSLQFRVVNRRANNLIEVEANVTLMTVEICNGRPERRFNQLSLERTQVLFLPLTWTVVHPIDEASPLFNKSEDDLKELQAEIVIMMRGFDETFGQVVYARYSYRYDEIIWGAKFKAAFEVEASGDLLLFVDRVGITEPAALPGVAS